MKIYQSTAPDGSVVQITGPDDATPDQVQAEMLRQYQAMHPQPAASVGDRVEGAVNNVVGAIPGGSSVASVAGSVAQAGSDAVDYVTNPTNFRALSEGGGAVAGGIAGAQMGAEAGFLTPIPGGAAIGSILGGVGGAVAGSLAGSANAELHDPSPNVATALQRAGDSAGETGTFQALGGVAGEALPAIGKAIFGGSTDETGKLLYDTAKKIPDNRIGLETTVPSRMLTDNPLYAKVDRFLSGSVGSYDAQARTRIAQQLTDDLKNSILNDPQSAGQVGSVLRDAIDKADKLTFNYAEAARGNLIQKMDNTGNRVDFKALWPKLQAIVARARVSSIGSVDDGLMRELQSKLGPDPSVISKLSFTAADGLRQSLSALSSREGYGKAQEMAQLVESSITQAAGPKLGQELTDQVSRNAQATEFFSTGAIASLAKQAPEKAADVLVTLQGQPNLARNLRRAIVKSSPDGPQVFQNVRDHALDNLIQRSMVGAADDSPAGLSYQNVMSTIANATTGGALSIPENVISGKALLNNLKRADSGGKYDVSTQLFGQATRDQLYKYGKALERVQKAPGNEGIIALRGAQTGALATLTFGHFGNGAGAGMIGLILVPGAFSRLVSRNPKVQALLIEGLSKGAQAAPLVKSTILSQMAAELKKNNALQGVVINGQNYDLNSPQAQDFLRNNPHGWQSPN